MFDLDLRNAKIYPRLMHHRYVDNAIAEIKRAGGNATDQMPVYKPWHGELVVGYAFDLGHSYVLMSESQREEVEKTQEQVHELAMSNLRESLKRVSVLAKMGVRRLRVGDELEAAAVLDNALWDYFHDEAKGDLLVTIPHRSEVMFIPADKKNARRRLIEAAKDAPRDNHNLTSQLFRYTENGFVAEAQ